MYQPYPTSGQPQEPERVQQPQSVHNAVRLMYAGAALSTVGLILNLLTIGSLKSAIVKADPNFTTSQVHAAETVGIAGAVIGGLIAIGLWLWMAAANGKGRSWARIVATVLFAVNTLDLVAQIARPHAVTALIFSVLVWLVGLGATVLIWNRESAPFYSQQKLA
jgi:hypothetical protein